MITITGTVGTSGKYLVTGTPVTTTAHTVLKIAFENNTAGTNLALLAGTLAHFTSGTGGTQLSDSGGPGFQFLSIIDTEGARRPGPLRSPNGWHRKRAICAHD